MATLAVNKRAKYDYEILDTYEGGLVLTGAEVKSIKAGHVQLKGAFLDIKNEELWLKNVFVTKYKPAGLQENYKADRSRKVLVHKREIKRLIGKKQAQGLTLIPLRVVQKGKLVKLEFGIGKGKKKHQKKEAIKKRDIDRDMKQRMSEAK